MTAQLGLTVKDLTVRYGGLVAVNEVSFDVPMGRLTGLIGPNGAGKTTTFNACTGMVRAARGDVFFGAANISHLGPHARARLGLGRTFQRMELFDRMSVTENVRLAREARFTGSRLLASFLSTRTESAAITAASDEAIELCGLDGLRQRQVGVLSTGQRRLVELARGLAGGFDVLLLDEPSSGLDRAETEALGRVLVDAITARGIGILLVEHDMSLVRTVCEYLYVLDFGSLLTSGPVAEVVSSDIVRAAYLGSEVA